MKVILVADFGSSNVRVHAIDVENGDIVVQHSVRYPLLSPRPGYYELDPKEMWNNSVICMRECLKKLKNESQICAISFSHIGSSLVPLDENFEPTYNCIVGMDSRAGLEGIELYDLFINNNWTIPETSFTFADISPMAKILYLRKHFPESTAQTKYYVSIQQYILKCLGLPLIWDASIAGSHACYNNKKRIWADEVLNAVGLDIEHLGKVVNSNEVIGEIKYYGDVALPYSIPVIIGGHDAVMGTIGLGVYDELEDVVAEVTGSVDVFCFLMNNVVTFTEEQQSSVRDGSLLMYEPGPLNGTTMCLSGYKTAGALLEWYLREIHGSTQENPYLELWSNVTLDGKSKVFVNPNFASNKGIIHGLDLSITKYDIYKACIEALTFESYLLLKNCEEMKSGECNRVRIGGGHAQAEQWVQLRADVSGKVYERTKNMEVSALGTAVLAAHGVGLYDSIHNAVKNMVKVRDCFIPNSSLHELYTEQFDNYLKLF